MLIISALLSCSCARIMALEGGPKDTNPPQLITAYPTEGGTGFKGKVIKLVFDKDIEVRDLYSNLVVTPQLQKLENKSSYTYNVRGKTLKLTLKVPLKEATTYTFDFNEAVKDTTEGNIAKGLVLAFSTGDHIDAMYVKGQVKHLTTNQPASKVLVSLYNASSTDRDILNSPPDYSTKTDETGKFKLDHVKKGQYYIYASTNKGGQQIADPSIDEYGFLEEPIDLTVTPADHVALSILKADVRTFKLQTQQPQDRYFELRFNKPIKDYTLTLKEVSPQPETAPVLYSHLVDNSQVIRVYNTFALSEEESLGAHLHAKDVLGTVIEEDIALRFKKINAKNSPATYTFLPHSGTAVGATFVGTMTVNKPVREVVADRLAFFFDSKNIVHLDRQDIQLNTQRDKITIRKQLDLDMMQSKEVLVLQMAEGAFVTVEEDSSQAMHYVYALKNPKEYGTIKGTVTTKAPGFIVQLLDQENNVVDSVKNEYDYQFHGVAPGSYKVRLLVLREKEGEWSLGNIRKRQAPDPMVFYQGNVAVIANWEIEGIDFFF